MAVVPAPEDPKKNPFFYLTGTKNQMQFIDNPYQGFAPRVLFLCSTGMLRAATAAHLFCQSPYFWNTRSAGVAVDYSLIPVSIPLLYWADRVVIMEPVHRIALDTLFSSARMGALSRQKGDNFFRVLDIPDGYGYNDAALIEEIQRQSTHFIT